MKESLNQILAIHTGRDLKKIQNDTYRYYFMTGEEAKEYGIIDSVIINREDLEISRETEA